MCFRHEEVTICWMMRIAGRSATNGACFWINCTLIPRPNIRKWHVTSETAYPGQPVSTVGKIFLSVLGSNAHDALFPHMPWGLVAWCCGNCVLSQLSNAKHAGFRATNPINTSEMSAFAPSTRLVISPPRRIFCSVPWDGWKHAWSSLSSLVSGPETGEGVGRLK